MVGAKPRGTFSSISLGHLPNKKLKKQKREALEEVAAQPPMKNLALVDDW